ncbi:hypothetical protein B0A58_02475 [Flavobacterium branchiophilum NBRC 15030 = ATCC 35035]|uniref:Uncharacterized protein n=1 Tax=Flavobacterium branchiophilum TaxID=55197 RepID=A0A543G2C2_9FLAO|nr:hypothetical protein [Flavobacterium branchiophilum]OXA80480.1 hypothetical protein B0A58_02475 [Flavobacterium branchiophilum NBRC 15030 = ATCC 35035]TQM40185.1 hypothetical protein BC670_1057 [Flavobacterium branchiophilum]GEM56129.1 hypothetical protein FB1_23500 [Flavobacterium branchiophilum NBRC 15030 = ATCC 35035]
MSLKIYGNLSPAVGKEEKYTIKAPFEEFNLFPPPLQPIDHKVKWYIYVLENGKWRKTKENEKTGETVSYTFTQKSLSRKGIKIEAQRGFETASEVIKPQRAEEQAILKVELLNAQENKPTKPFSYGQTVVAKATCTGMEYQMINLTLWEDDAKGAAHSPINQKNRATTKTVEVKRGIAKTSFKLMPSFAKMAEAFQTNGGEGKLHEYYVTASLRNLQSASNNIDVNALEEPAPPVKKKIPVQDPKKPKPNVPKPSTPTKSSVKKEITEVKIFKTSDTTLKVHVYYNGLQGKKIRFKLMEDDGGYLVDDELINQVFDLPKNSDCMYIDIDLKKVSKSKGDDMLEGSEQELFVDIEVLETASHHKTATLNVNNSGFKQDPVDDTNKVVKVAVEEKKKEDGTCECKQYDLIWGDKVSCDERKKVVEVSKNLGVNPNWLMAVMALESAKTFSPSIDNGIGYVGLIQFGKDAATTVGTTQSKLIKMTFIEQMDYVQKFLIGNKTKYKTLVDLYLSVLYPSACGHGSERDYVVLKGKAYKNNPLFFEEEDEITRNRKGKIISRHPKVGGNTYVWEVDLAIKSVYAQGSPHKAKIFSCGVDTQNKTQSKCKCKKTHIDLRDSIKWQSQFDSQWGNRSAQNVACWKTSQQILTKSGLGSTSGYPTGAIQLAKETDNHTKISYLPEGLKAGINYIDQELEINHPVLVGVNHDLNYRGEKNVDHTTDHFVVIIGRNCDDKGAFYLFYEVGTSYKQSGASDDNKLYILTDRIEGKTSYNSAKTYQISQVRLNK